jgi:hypothetical protein
MVFGLADAGFDADGGAGSLAAASGSGVSPAIKATSATRLTGTRQ